MRRRGPTAPQRAHTTSSCHPELPRGDCVVASAFTASAPARARLIPPLTRSDTLELAAAGTELGLQMALSVDVGWLLTAETCAAIRDAGVAAVSFSLHFPDRERSDVDEMSRTCRHISEAVHPNARSRPARPVHRLNFASLSGTDSPGALHALDHRLPESRGRDLVRAFHQPGEVVR
jgi:L-rhamnose isomerase